MPQSSFLIYNVLETNIKITVLSYQSQLHADGKGEKDAQKETEKKPFDERNSNGNSTCIRYAKNMT
jgi:hypothetical protein